MKLQGGYQTPGGNYTEMFDNRQNEELHEETKQGFEAAKKEDSADSNIEINSGDEAQKPLIKKVSYFNYRTIG